MQRGVYFIYGVWPSPATAISASREESVIPCHFGLANLAAPGDGRTPATVFRFRKHVLLNKPDNSFKEFVLDQLGALPELRAKAMFGGHGLYQAERFFGILLEGRLYFKADEQSRAAYLERGMSPFTYEMKGRTMTMSYYEVPPEVLENAAELVGWADRAIQVAASKPRLPKK